MYQNDHLKWKSEFICIQSLVLSDFINLTQVHNFTVSAQDSFTFRRLSVFTVSFTRILQVLMQIMNILHCTTDQSNGFGTEFTTKRT